MRNHLGTLFRAAGMLMPLAALAMTAPANAALLFDKSFTPDTIAPNGTSTLRFDIAETGGRGAAGVSFTDTLPNGVTIADPPNGISGCGGTLSATAGGEAISFTGGSVLETCSISVDVTSSTPGTHTNNRCPPWKCEARGG